MRKVSLSQPSSMPSLPCSNIDSVSLNDPHNEEVAFDVNNVKDEGEGKGATGQDDQSDLIEGKDEVLVEIEKLGNNSRRIRFQVSIDASLETIWNMLTDYEKLADILPGLASSELIDKKDNVARVRQIGSQSTPFGLRFDSRFVFDFYEKELEILPSGKRRNVEFTTSESPFQVFEGKWSIEQLSKSDSEDYDFSHDQEFQAFLSYSLDMKPKFWMPVQLVERLLCEGTKANLLCLREEAQKKIRTGVGA
uniref:Uncharacterized protein LOC105642727 isoform X3 n=1 Tax=Rhizophora mucronata TaxID=61149 RepID=A0A2P2L6L8_RHIMU